MQKEQKVLIVQKKIKKKYRKCNCNNFLNNAKRLKIKKKDKNLTRQKKIPKHMLENPKKFESKASSTSLKCLEKKHYLKMSQMFQ